MSKTSDFEVFKATAIEQLKAGVLASLFENLLNGTLEGEMDSHLNIEEKENWAITAMVT